MLAFPRFIFPIFCVFLKPFYCDGSFLDSFRPQTWIETRVLFFVKRRTCLYRESSVLESAGFPRGGPAYVDLFSRVLDGRSGCNGKSITFRRIFSPDSFQAVTFSSFKFRNQGIARTCFVRSSRGLFPSEI